MTIEMVETDNKRFATFDSVVRLICTFLKKPNSSQMYVDAARFLALVLEEFEMNMFPNIKSVLLPINDNFTINLPDDCMEVTKVGVLTCDRQLRILGHNSKLSSAAFPKAAAIECCTCETTKTSSCSDDTDSCCAACTFNNFNTIAGGYASLGQHYLYGHSGYLYGYNPEDNFREGTYQVDEVNNRLLLGNGCGVNCDSELVVEYKAVLTGDGFRLIPRKARNALMYRVAYMLTDKPSYWAQFKVHYRELKRTYDIYSLDDWVNAVRGGYTPAPKR
jgi:hypothetical protein